MADEPVLIALSIDGVLAVYRQRALVREAHAAIAQEIDANLSDLEGALPALDAHDRHLEQALRFADDLLRTGKTDVHELRFALNFASLNRASWQTAERTGALSSMNYAQVREYSELYDLQALVVESQQRLIGQLANLSAIVFGGEGGDPYRLKPRDLEVFVCGCSMPLAPWRCIRCSRVSSLTPTDRPNRRQVPSKTDALT